MPTMPRSKETLPSTDSSSGSSGGPTVMSLSDLKMGLDNKQRDLILMDMAASRRKLEEENRMLRDELEEAQVKIQLLKFKLVDQGRTNHGLGGASTPLYGRWFRNKESKITRKDIKKFEKAANQPYFGKVRAKDATFQNPTAPGRKIFSSKKVSDESRLYDTSKPSIIFIPNDKQANETTKGKVKPSTPRSKSTPSSLSQAKGRPAKIAQKKGAVQHRSVMDKLTLSIIDEHWQSEDAVFVDYESVLRPIHWTALNGQSKRPYT